MQEILNYLKQNIDEEATVEKWNAKQFLNLHLAGSYDYYKVTVLAEQFLLIRPVEIQTIQKTMVHIARIQEKTKLDVAVLLEDATPYRVKKMLEARIAFLAVDKQMYLPFMALHIKKQREKQKETTKRDKFTAATQLIFLAFLYSDKEEFSAEEMAKDLNLSTMTVLRATDELMRLGILSCEIGGQTGRKKLFKSVEKREYYHVGKEYLMNPVKKTIYVKDIPDKLTLYKSGLTALGEQTMLGEPSQKTFAISSWVEELGKYQVSEEQAREESLSGIQIMQYDIGRLTTNEYVDSITLILGLDEMDDRIEIAIEELMKETEWYEA